MKKSKPHLLKIPFMDTFERTYTINNNSNLLLDTIEIYSCDDELKRIAFDIYIDNSKERKKIIQPLLNKTGFLIYATKIVKGYEFKIEPSDYFTVYKDKDGNYIFHINSDSADIGFNLEETDTDNFDDREYRKDFWFCEE